MEAKSRWQDIFDNLTEYGFDVYSPSTKVGECKEPYIVVKNNGSNRYRNYSTDEDLYSIMCYVPASKYSNLEPMIQEVKKAMKALEPMIMPYGMQTPSFYDDSYKAHTVSIIYKNYKKML